MSASSTRHRVETGGRICLHNSVAELDSNPAAGVAELTPGILWPRGKEFFRESLSQCFGPIGGAGDLALNPLLSIRLKYDAAQGEYVVSHGGRRPDGHLAAADQRPQQGPLRQDRLASG